MSLMTFLNYSAMSRALNYPAELFHTYLEHSFTADNNSGRNIVDLKRIFILFRKSHSSPQIGEKKKLLMDAISLMNLKDIILRKISQAQRRTYLFM